MAECKKCGHDCHCNKSECDKCINDVCYECECEQYEQKRYSFGQPIGDLPSTFTKRN